MTDLKPQFIELLKRYDVSPTTSQPRALPRPDQFVDEAYKINARINEVKIFLRDIRPSYLAKDIHPRRNLNTSKRQSKCLSNRDKEEIDAKVKQIFRELIAGIRILAEAEEIRRQTEISLVKKKYGQWSLGSIGVWAAGGMGQVKSHEQEVEEARIQTMSTHRENILYFLRERLNKWADEQASMMQKRISREMEKKSELLGQARFTDSIPDFSASLQTLSSQNKVFDLDRMGEDQNVKVIDELSPEQIQTFEKDNQDMLRHYESTLNQVRTAEKSLVEISELQNQLVHNLTVQSAHIEQLVADSHLTSDNVGGGNIQLKKATQRKSTAKYVFYASCGLSLFLVVWDFFI